MDKRYSTSIELTRRQYSGNAHRVIRSIGLISCVYVNGETGQFWVIDYRVYDPDGDGLELVRPCGSDAGKGGSQQAPVFSSVDG
ncbi:hypothetical protein [Gloeocapsopsis sp. IPPAS B-1203]|uniref:hypothetical protein n=1 Tax=Gloeocapsopsis sp. IPPAS B-1203 TaxID=2049454 RepID=UPI0025A1619B|nr:hypothetical protein [Gloeocapsopsis sp. IPPAS B-1203]